MNRRTKYKTGAVDRLREALEELADENGVIALDGSSVEAGLIAAGFDIGPSVDHDWPRASMYRALRALKDSGKVTVNHTTLVVLR